MQKEAFAWLYAKYQDTETSPATEKVGVIRSHYIIKSRRYPEKQRCLRLFGVPEVR
jgi:hypothetical protein